MKVIVEDIRFLNPSLGETNTTNWLLANIGDVEEVEIDIRYEDYVLATGIDPDADEIVLVTHPSSLTMGGIIRDERHLWTNDPIGFETIQEGDEVTVSPVGFATEVKTVLEKVNNQLLLMDTVFTHKAVLAVDSIAYVTTPIEAIEFFNGIIENSSPVNYEDLTTGNVRRARVEGLDNTDTSSIIPMQQLGDKAYQYGSLTVTGNGIGDGPTSVSVSQAFTIKHTFLVSPLFLADQLSDELSDISPSYLRDANSLKYVFKVEASKDLNNPNDIKTVVEGSQQGNVGNTGENFNTGLTDYAIEDVVYKRLSGEVITSLELTTNEQTVEFDITNSSGLFSGFSIGNTLFVANHWFMPVPEDEYREPEFPNGVNTAKSTLLKTNFLFDRIECTLDTLATAPDNLGEVDQIIKECTTTWVSGERVSVILSIEMSTQAVARIAALTDQNYKLTISTKDYLLTRAKSDKINLVIDRDVYFIESTDPTMISITNGFYDHPMVDGDTVKESLVVRPQDDVVDIFSFTLDRNDITDFDRADAAIDFLSVTTQVIASNGTSSFTLDEYSTAFDGLQIIDDATYGTVPEIDVEEDRGFISPVDDLRRNMVIKRRYDLDSSGVFAYQVNYPFIMRWEPWESLPAANNEFLDPTAAANAHKGKNHDWYHYFDGTTWEMFTKITIVATKDGTPLTYTGQYPLVVEDYTDGGEWNTEVQRAYRTDSAGDLITGFGVMLTENTLIQGEATYISTDVPTLPDLVMVLNVTIFERTNYRSQYMISSKYDIASDNAWIGLLGILKSTKSNPSGNIFRVEAELNYLNFTPDTTVRIATRIYDTRAESGIPDGKETEQGVLKTDEIGFVKDIE